MDVIHGPGCVAEWDQARAEASKRLRHSTAFVLITLPEDSTKPEFITCSYGLSPLAMAALLTVTVECVALEAVRVSEYAKHEGEQEAA